MAIRIVSPTGGIWTSTTTWVGGVVPTTSDSVVADATSGNFYLSTNPQVLNFDTTDFTGVFGLSGSSGYLQIRNDSATASFILGTAMTFTFSHPYNNGINFINVATPFNQVKLNGKPLPRLDMQIQGNTGIQFLDPIVEVIGHSSQNWNSQQAIRGNNNGQGVDVRFYNTFVSSQGGGGVWGTGVTFSFVGSTTNAVRGAQSNQMYVCGLALVINSGSATQSFSNGFNITLNHGSQFGNGGGTNSSGSFTYISGNLISNNIVNRPVGIQFCGSNTDAVPVPLRVNASGYTFSYVFSTPYNTTSTTKVELLSDLNFGTFSIAKNGTPNVNWLPQGQSPTVVGKTLITGVGVLKGIDISPELLTITASGTHSITGNILLPYAPPTMISSFNQIIGTGSSNIILQVGTGSSKDAFYTTFRNINSVYGIYDYKGTFSNSTNITIVNSLAPTTIVGAGGSSTTFLI